MDGAWEEAGAQRDAILAGYGQEGIEAAWVEAGTAATDAAAAAVDGEYGDDKAATRAASAAVLDALRESSRGKEEGEKGKLARSEFVGFISQLSRGELELEGNTVGVRMFRYL